MLKKEIETLKYFVDRNINFAHPRARGQFEGIRDAADAAWRNNELSSRFGVFEVYRNARRQHYMTSVDDAAEDIFDSPMQYGLAFHLAPFDLIDNGKERVPQWLIFTRKEKDYTVIENICSKYGCFADVTKARGVHVIHPLWFEVRSVLFG